MYFLISSLMSCCFILVFPFHKLPTHSTSRRPFSQCVYRTFFVWFQSYNRAAARIRSYVFMFSHSEQRQCLTCSLWHMQRLHICFTISFCPSSQSLCSISGRLSRKSIPSGAISWIILSQLSFTVITSYSSPPSLEHKHRILRQILRL